MVGGLSRIPKTMSSFGTCMYTYACVHVYACVYMCMYVCVSGIQKAVESPGAGAAGGCEPVSHLVSSET